MKLINQLGVGTILIVLSLGLAGCDAFLPPQASQPAGTAVVSDTAWARSVLKDVLERSKNYDNVRFSDTPGSRSVAVRSLTGERGEETIDLVCITSVESYYDPSIKGTGIQGYGIKYKDYNDTQPLYFVSSYLSESDAEAVSGTKAPCGRSAA